jgi:hypothetical protein
MITGVAVAGHRVFVASMNDNDPSADPTWRVRVVSDDLADVGPSQIALAHPQHVSLSGLGLSSDGRGGLAWDEASGCRFVALGGDGAPSAPPVLVGDEHCYWLAPTATGFLAFSSPSFTLTSLTLLRLGPDGALLGTAAVGLPDQGPSSYPLGRARLDDGSFLFAWRDGASVRAARVGEGGALLAPPTTLFPVGGDVDFAMTSVGDHALVAWSPDVSLGEVRSATLGADGTLGPETPLATEPQALYRLTIGAVPGGALVVWSGGVGELAHLGVQPVDASGAAHGDAVTIASPPSPWDARVVGTPAGAMVVYGGEQPGTLTQVFAARLACE